MRKNVVFNDDIFVKLDDSARIYSKGYNKFTLALRYTLTSF